jgi:transposase
MTPSSQNYIGIDAAKAELEVANGQSLVGRFANSAAGMQAMQKSLPEPREVALVVIESTGCYSQLAARTLTTAGYRVAVVQPGRIRHYARSQGQLAKTDRIDARIIAHYGERTPDLRVYQEPSATRQRLRALVDRRDQVVEDRVREENRLEACQDEVVRKHLRTSIARLRKQADILEADIATVIASDADLTGLRAVLESLTGIGSITAATLLAHLPELGHVNRQEIAALAGVAPYNNDSGAHRGARSIYGGRQRVRTAMHMAAVCAARCDEQLSGFYAKLRERGKPAKVALVAVTRKMLIKLNSLVTDYHRTLRNAATPPVPAPT